jgi:hypothetical protein
MIVKVNSNEKETISSLYQNNNGLTIESIVFKDWLSPDYKYAIILDELYDLEERKGLGNIWEDFSNLTTFLKHIFEVSKNIPQELKESAKEFLGSLVIVENNNIYERKLIIQQLVNEQNWLQQFGNWAANKGKEAVAGVADFAKKSYDGAKKLIGNISQGEWTKVLDLVKKGVLYVARSIRNAMYHPVGLVLDGILVATGIGKGVQWVPWAIVVALDIYELATGDYQQPDEPMWLKLLFLGCDIIGLVFAGGAAKAAKTLINSTLKGVRTTKEAAKIVAKTPGLKSIIQKIASALGSVGTKMGQAVSFLKSKFPKGAQFIESIMGKLSGFVKKLSDSVNGLLGRSIASAEAQAATKLTGGQKVVKGSKEALKQTGLVYGIEKGFEKAAQLFTGKQPSTLTPLAAQSLEVYAKEGGFDKGWD